MVVDQSKPKCEHENCLCVVPEGQRYCSFHCEQAATQLPASVQAQCGCGHAECNEAHAGGSVNQPHA